MQKRFELMSDGIALTFEVLFMFNAFMQRAPLLPRLRWSPRKQQVQVLLDRQRQAKYGLYFWDTSNPQYAKIVSSASCLSFSFRESATNNNFTINVPFKLLNLTLTAPLTATPTQYFPCKAETQSRFQLGRAFLQAAFVGANWDAYSGSAAWWLAQAPGPNIPSQVTIIDIATTDTTITGSNIDWASTWKGSWTPLAQPSSTSTSMPASSSTAGADNANNSPKQSGLSTGAKAGIGAGVGVAAIGALGGLFLLWSRRHKKSDEATPDSNLPETHRSPVYESKPAVFNSPTSPASNQMRQSIPPGYHAEVEGSPRPDMYELHT